MNKTFALIQEHRRIIWALLLREIATRYGRNNLGFLWVFAEPMVFAVGVLIMWRLIHGQYENGIAVVPFILTGYMPMILVRHIVGYSVNAIKINNALLYHKSLSVLDLYLGRIILEFLGVSLSGITVFVALLLLGIVPLPAYPLIIYEAWFIDLLICAGLALVVGVVSELFEVVERIISVMLYLLVPVSGTFFLADWLPEPYRGYVLALPFLHVAEMMRYGFFGSQVHPHYNAAYAALWGACMVCVGLLLMRQVRQRIEVY
jgi:capsular polysaccharide transport system permease protein